MLLLPLLAGCNSKETKESTPPEGGAKADSTVSVRDSVALLQEFETEKELLLQRVVGIYRVVKNVYMNNGHYSTDETLDKSYCSASWNKLLFAVHRKEEKTNTLFFDNDYWVMSPELGYVSYEGFKVEDLVLTPERRAAVTFTIYHSDSYVPARIDMVYEEGTWVIDDFEDLKYIKSWKKGMTEFVADNKRE